MVDSKQQWKAWVYLAPALVLLAVFTVYPIISSVRFAFLEGYKPLSSVGGETYGFGIGNFINVLNYPKFKTAFTNTFLLCFLTVPLSCFLALIIAVCLNSIKKFSSFLQTLYFLPYVTNSIAIGMVFSVMFNIVGFSPSATGSVASSWGVINDMLMGIGLKPIHWIDAYSSYWNNIFVLVIYSVWSALPFKILILLGGLQSVNKQYYDAAKIDGASRGRIFWKITVPLLSPMIAYVVITGFIGGFKVYSSIVGIFGENMGPSGSPDRLQTIVGYIYDQLQRDAYGTASAASLVLFGVILIITCLNLYVSSKKVHY